MKGREGKGYDRDYRIQGVWPRICKHRREGKGREGKGRGMTERIE